MKSVYSAADIKNNKLIPNFHTDTPREEAKEQLSSRIGDIKRNQHEQPPHLLVSRPQSSQNQRNKRKRITLFLGIRKPIIRKITSRRNINAWTATRQLMLRRVGLDGGALMPGVRESAIRALSETEIAGVRSRRIGSRVLVLRLRKTRIIIHFE